MLATMGARSLSVRTSSSSAITAVSELSLPNESVELLPPAAVARASSVAMSRSSMTYLQYEIF